MKLLIITQKIEQNDDILGFFHRWIEEFAKKSEKIIVVAQFVGSYDLSKNVEVFSLGKELGYSKIRQLINFYRLLFRSLPNIDAVFVHMIPLWVILGWPICKIDRKKIYLWYTHKSVNFILRLAEKLVSKIFTASKESFRLESKKVIITGHGIDVEKFKKVRIKSDLETEFPSGNSVSKFRIITAGRIAPVKNYEVLIETAEILKNKNFNFSVEIAGAPIFEQDKIYLEKLKNLIKEKNIGDKIKFVGAIPYRNIAEFYQSGDLFVNFSDTGSLDKAVLEAMASGLLVLTFNEAFKNILPAKYFISKNPDEIAERILILAEAAPDSFLQNYVFQNHNLESLIGKISDMIEKPRNSAKISCSL